MSLSCGFLNPKKLMQIDPSGIDWPTSSIIWGIPEINTSKRTAISTGNMMINRCAFFFGFLIFEIPFQLDQPSESWINLKTSPFFHIFFYGPSFFGTISSTLTRFEFAFHQAVHQKPPGSSQQAGCLTSHLQDPKAIAKCCRSWDVLRKKQD